MVRELGRGDALGELALLTRSPRSASVRAARASDLVAIDREHFEELLQSSPALSLSLNRILGEQLRTSQAAASTSRPRPATVALRLTRRAGAGGRSSRSCSPRRSEAQLDTELLRAAASSTGSPRRRHRRDVFAPLLDRAEAGHELVLLDAGPARRREPVDGVLPPAGRPHPRPHRRWPGPRAVAARSELRGCDLVAVRRRPRRAGGGREWATRAGGERVPRRARGRARRRRRADRAAAERQVGRGRAVGRRRAGVLAHRRAGGTARRRRDRSTASLGVSMGAFVGALFAMGLEIEEIDARCFEEWVQRRPLGDYTIPRYSLIRGERAQSDDAADVRRVGDRGAPAELHVRLHRAAQRQLHARPPRPAVGDGRLQHVPADHRARRRRAGASCSSTARWSTTFPSRRWPTWARGRSSRWT